MNKCATCGNEAGGRVIHGGQRTVTRATSDLAGALRRLGIQFPTVHVCSASCGDKYLATVAVAQ